MKELNTVVSMLQMIELTYLITDKSFLQVGSFYSGFLRTEVHSQA